YATLLKDTEGSGKNPKLFNEFIRMDIDFMNLINFLRLKRDQEEPAQVMAYMMEGGLLLPLNKLKALAAM
ncbi:MAG: hypothetical protein GWN18_16815, partial [Thermoplasmata archaeon]|nr:hypothetical protein [Thermoplasmata archaeon]NIS13770.1 hypothetical protein [Thermoplasmata archaeon]NIS21621.1 hypothetical protein [Thermoplasmata archaeon]NIT79202.1 hypothetical protein [Thermoplasmata archaeon]NIU50651.1 hypothetical protein [Thermoplasmata archaeon]